MEKEKIIGVVSFWNLGRSKAIGQFIVNATSIEDFNKQLYSEFSKHLLSRDIAFSEGKIYAGFHKVGDFAFIVKTKQATV